MMNKIILPKLVNDLQKFMMNNGGFYDVCFLIRATTTYDDSNKPKQTLTTDSVSVEARVVAIPVSAQLQTRGSETAQFDTVAHFPIDTRFTDDEGKINVVGVRHVMKHGRTITPIDYDVVGQPVEVALEKSLKLSKTTNKANR